jgi:uncharacterized membrane protein
MAYNQDGGTSAKPVLWDPAIRRLVHAPDYYDAATYAASQNGATVVGGGQIGNGQGPVRQQAFRATSQGIFDLPGFAPSDFTYAYDITPDARTIVGAVGSGAVAWTDNQAPHSLPAPDAATSTRAQSVSADASVIAGTFSRAGNTEFCVWRNGSVTPLDLPAGTRFSGQVSVSLDASRVAGSYIGAMGVRSAFTWTADEGITPLDGIVSALCISGDGLTIGGATSTSNAALWSHGDTFLVRDLLASQGIDLSAWTLSSVTGISADGRTITGNGTHRFGPSPTDMRSEAWVAVIPAPGAATLLLAAAPVAVSRRRR